MKALKYPFKKHSTVRVVLQHTIVALGNFSVTISY